MTIVGRITLDADSLSSGTKLNEASLSVESSRAMGSGVRVPLRFDTNVRVRGAQAGRGGMGFFVGAIAALRGKNGGGGWFHVSEVLTVSLIHVTANLISEYGLSYPLPHRAHRLQARSHFLRA